MATAKNFTMSFLGASGRRYQISGYTADTAGHNNTFNPSGAAAAASLQYWRPQENVTLVDFSMPTGTTQTSGYMTQDGANRAGTLLDYVIHVSTNPYRPTLSIPFPAGCLIGSVTI